jgi:hypothetical protein
VLKRSCWPCDHGRPNALRWQLARSVSAQLSEVVLACWVTSGQQGDLRRPSCFCPGHGQRARRPTRVRLADKSQGSPGVGSGSAFTNSSKLPGAPGFGDGINPHVLIGCRVVRTHCLRRLRTSAGLYSTWRRLVLIELHRRQLRLPSDTSPIRSIPGVARPARGPQRARNAETCRGIRSISARARRSGRRRAKFGEYVSAFGGPPATSESGRGRRRSVRVGRAGAEASDPRSGVAAAAVASLPATALRRQ